MLCMVGSREAPSAGVALKQMPEPRKELVSGESVPGDCEGTADARFCASGTIPVAGGLRLAVSDLAKQRARREAGRMPGQLQSTPTVGLPSSGEDFKSNGTEVLKASPPPAPPPPPRPHVREPPCLANSRSLACLSSPGVFPTLAFFSNSSPRERLGLSSPSSLKLFYFSLFTSLSLPPSLPQLR